MTRPIVENNVAISLRRMGVETLDLLQFHWWDYEDSAYLDALTHLSHLRDAGKLQHLALTNFDTAHLQTITEHGIQIVSNQVQYFSHRPPARGAYGPLCQEHNISLLTYGTFCGGLLSDAYLGQPEPERCLNTASLRKYKQMIDAWGGWALFRNCSRCCSRLLISTVSAWPMWRCAPSSIVRRWPGSSSGYGSV
jgi:aryl-alcohol dehydrogenase-like predicted oxidoreductase